MKYQLSIFACVIIPLISNHAFSSSTIAAGGAHTLVVDTDGYVWSTGVNTRGQLGNGTYDNSTVFKRIDGLENIIAVAAGLFSSLALDKDGRVWAFGSVKEIVPENSEASNIPTIVDGLQDIIAIAAGNEHNLALNNKGQVLSFGIGTSGQLGHGKNVNYLPVPQIVQGLTDCVAVAAGGYHSLVLDSKGDVFSFGEGLSGQLGHGTNMPLNVPEEIKRLKNIVAIAAGTNHSIAVDRSGKVFTFGRSVEGALGTTMKKGPIFQR